MEFGIWSMNDMKLKWKLLIYGKHGLRGMTFLFSLSVSVCLTDSVYLCLDLYSSLFVSVLVSVCLCFRFAFCLSIHSNQLHKIEFIFSSSLHAQSALTLVSLIRHISLSVCLLCHRLLVQPVSETPCRPFCNWNGREQKKNKFLFFYFFFHIFQYFVCSSEAHGLTVWQKKKKKNKKKIYVNWDK